MDDVDRAFAQAADQEEQREKAEKEARERQQRRGDLLGKVLQTEEGRKFLWMHMEDCNIFAPVFDKDHAVMALHEGRRQVGLRLMSDISTAFPDFYNRMANENMLNEKGDQ